MKASLASHLSPSLLLPVSRCRDTATAPALLAAAAAKGGRPALNPKPSRPAPARNAALAGSPAAPGGRAGVGGARAPRGAAGPVRGRVGARPAGGAQRRRGGQGAPEGRGDRRPGAEPVRLHQVARQAGGHAAQRWGVPTAESAACSSGPFRASPQGAFLIPFSLPRHCRCFVFPTVFVGRFRFPSIFEFLWTYTSNFRQIPLLVFSAFSPDNFTMFSTCLH